MVRLLYYSRKYVYQKKFYSTDPNRQAGTPTEAHIVHDRNPIPLRGPLSHSLSHHMGDVSSGREALLDEASEEGRSVGKYATMKVYLREDVKQGTFSFDWSKIINKAFHNWPPDATAKEKNTSPPRSCKSRAKLPRLAKGGKTFCHLFASAYRLNYHFFHGFDANLSKVAYISMH